MYADLVLYNINQIFSPNDFGRPLKGTEMAQADIIENGYIAVKDGKILKVGSGNVPKDILGSDTELKDLKGYTVTPGLIDSHTHLVHGGSRENEFNLKLSGVSYLDILKAGGGILSTVKATQNATFDELYDKAEASLNTMLIHGTTTVEGKSGYGLNWETEEKQLKVAKKLNENHPADIISTFMGAHAIPTEYKAEPEVFVKQLIEDMIPKVAQMDLAHFCDVFCEEGVFSVDQTRRILQSAKDSGLKLKLHADEIVSLGGAELAAEMGTHTADHLMAASEKGMELMAENNIIANLLPGTTFSLMKNTYADARKMLEKNLALALSTDYNPGSCPTENLQLIMQLGSLAMKMTPIEVFNAVTINGAYALDKATDRGSLKEGKNADLVVFNAPNLDYILYHFGVNHVKEVYKLGKLVVKDRNILF